MSKKDKCGWPQDEVDLDLLGGAVEAGCDLYTFGSFGGMGGRLYGPIFKSFKEALKYRKDLNSEMYIDLYRVKVEYCKEFEEFERDRHESVNTEDTVKTLYEVEKETILSTLSKFNGHKVDAASALGITLKTLYNKLHEYGEFK